MVADFHIQRVSWAEAADALQAVRLAVFVREQGVPLELEWDDRDAGAVHVLARSAEGDPIATGRLWLAGRLGHIGRMAVLAPWRGRGVGSAVLSRLLHEARASGAAMAALNAQAAAVPFYVRHGFVREGEAFLDAGIPHYRMTRSL